MPQLVPNEVFSNAAVWNSSGFQVASVAGPAIGGLIIALCGSAAPVYGVNFALELVVMGLISLITVRFTQSKKQAMSRDNLVAGIRFVWRTKVILAAITLDMFAVLLGGVTMLLPIYAKDIPGGRPGRTGLASGRTLHRRAEHGLVYGASPSAGAPPAMFYSPWSWGLA